MHEQLVLRSSFSSQEQERQNKDCRGLLNKIEAIWDNNQTKQIDDKTFSLSAVCERHFQQPHVLNWWWEEKKKTNTTQSEQGLVATNEEFSFDAASFPTPLLAQKVSKIVLRVHKMTSRNPSLVKSNKNVCTTWMCVVLWLLASDIFNYENGPHVVHKNCDESLDRNEHKCKYKTLPSSAPPWNVQSVLLLCWEAIHG